MPVQGNTSTRADDQVFPGRYVTLSEARALLEREQAEREELTYEQRLSLDHSTHFVRLPPEAANELVEKLQALELTDQQATKIADLAPATEDDVRAVFAKERMTPDAEIVDKIVDLVQEHL